jgi:hypothetical protein
MKKLTGLVGGVAVVLVLGSSLASAQQVMWKDNPISGKVVGLTYGTSSWTAGEAQAVAYGGHLVTIRSQAEQAWLIAAFGSHWTVAGVGPYIGLTDASQEGNWRWISGEDAGSGPLFWGPSEPNGGTAENYTCLSYLSSGVLWADIANSFYSQRSLIEVAQRPPRSWSWPTAYATGSRPSYGCTFDMDGDGDLDYASPDRDSGQVSIWRNNGSGVFALANTVGGCGLAVTSIPTDWDSDGDLDLLLTDYAASGRLLYIRNNGASWVLQASLASMPYCHGLAIGDVNADGRVDVVTTSLGTDDRARVFLRQSDGSLAAPVVYGPFFDEAYQPTLADLDLDGALDLVIAGGEVRILRGSALGSFTDCGNIGAGRSLHCAAADLDGDGRDEILVNRVDADVVEVWKATTAGPLTAAIYGLTQSLACGDGPYWVATGDVDGDGDLDVVVPSHLSDTVHILRNTPNGLVQDHVLAGQDYALYTAVADLNSDSKPDILTSNHLANAFSVHLNQSIFDCNTNGIDDPLDITSGFATDCNSNGRPDTCDLAFGLSQDSDGDGILNECEPTLVSLTPSTRPAALPGTVTLSATNIPAGAATLTLSSPTLPTPITLPITLITTTGNQRTASVTLPSLFATLTNGSADDVTCSGTLSWADNQGNTQVTGATPNIFTFDVPEIVAATPSNAPFDQTTGVVFTLEDHFATSGVGTAQFGNLPPQAATLFSVGGMTKVVTSAPAAPAPGPVSVRLQFGGEITLEQRGFVYLGPGLTSQSATHGWQAGGEALSFGLYDFAPGVPMQVVWKQGASSVSVSGTPSGLLVNASLTVTTPLLPSAGVWDLELVQNAGAPNEKRVLSPGAWLADAPSLLSIAPASAYQGGGETVTLSLAGFTAGSNARVRLGSAEAFATIGGSLAAGTMSIVAPLSTVAGPVDVQVTQNPGQVGELGITVPGAFTYVGPSIQSVLPNAGPLEGGTLVTVQTSGFQEGVPAQVSLGGFTVNGTVTGSGNSQTVSFQTVLANASGPADLTITQGIFNASLPAAFVFDPARVVNYCAAKLTSQGLLPQISFTGSPSAGVNDFKVTLSNALPNKTAQYIYGLNQNNFPLWGGTLCVATSIVRGPVTMTNAGGVASVPFGVPPGLVGSTRYFQYWFRDPQDPAGYGYGLSGGLQVEFYP